MGGVRNTTMGGYGIPRWVVTEYHDGWLENTMIGGCKTSRLLFTEYHDGCISISINSHL